MERQTKQELRALLNSELEDQTRLGNFTWKDRVRWLTTRLREYLRRWDGFRAISKASMQAAVEHTLFSAVEVGTEAVSQELASPHATGELLGSWQLFRECLVRTRSIHDRESAGQLQGLLDSWESKLG